MISRVAPAGEGLRAQIRFTERAEGDFSIAACEGVADRRSLVCDRPWSWLRQVHGAAVRTVAAPGDQAGRRGDALVTCALRAPLAIQSADCAAVMIVGEGVIGAAHAGWRGLLSGVVESTVATMSRLGATKMEAVVGPCIGPSSYEFGDRELDAVAARFGDIVRARTHAGRPALDLAGAVQQACIQSGIEHLERIDADTASSRWFSHRCRGDLGRQSAVIWMEGEE